MASGAIAYAGGYSILMDPDNPPRLFGTIEVWDAGRFEKYPFIRTADFQTPRSDFQLRGELSEFRDTVTTLAFSADGELLATGGGQGANGSFVAIWEIPSGELLRSIGPADSVVGQLALSPDGKTIATVGSLHSRERRLFPEVTTAYDRAIQIWNLEDGTLRCRLEGHDLKPISVAFSPDGRFLASGGFDKTIRLWDLESQRLVATLTGHDGAVISLAYAPDGRSLASGSSDTTILIWDVASVLMGER